MSTEQVLENPPSPDQPQKKETKTNEKHPKNDKRQKNEKNEKDDKNDKNEEKKVRHERPAELERNADLITIDTVLAPLPKKNEIIQKPNLKDYQDKETKNRERVGKIIEEKKKIFAEKFKPTKVIAKGEGGKHNEFNAEIEEFKDIKERFNEVRTQRNAKRDLLKNLFDEAKENVQIIKIENAELKKLKEQSKNSKENVEDELESLEHKLITSDISKEQERALQSEITILKRKLREAQPAGNIEVRIEKAEQRREELSGEIDRAKEEKEPLEEEYTSLKTELDSKNESINKIKGDLKNENEQKTELKEERNKEYEDWKEKKSKRLDELSAKIKVIDEETKNLWKEYKAKNEAHWEQKHKLDFLEWQHRVKDAKLRAIEREKRNALYEQKQKEREKEEQLQKYIKEIGICNTLITYLQDISRKDEPQQKTEQKKVEPENINAKLDEDSQWKKEKGLIVVQSKKSKEDEEVTNKKGGKKNKKKAEKTEEGKVQKFEIPFNVQILFDQIKVLPPDSLEEVDNKIGEIKDREALFERGCQEQVSEDDKQQIEKIAAGSKKEKKVVQKNEGDDFPTL